MANHMDKNDLQGLRFWCMKVLPTIYDDSLSYYEVLCKIGQKLNTTLANLITLGDDFDTLEADITKKLQDFLTQYRADLKEVQDEVTATLAGYDAEIKKVQQDFADFSAAVDANFAKLTADVQKILHDEIENVNAQVDSKLAAVDTAVSAKLTAVQNQIDSAVAQLNSDFDTLEASVNQTLTTFQTNISNQQTAFENSVNGNITELEGKFTALQTYVDNYFANLDVTAAVTQAVNTKIQQMIDSGEFAELFGDQIDGKLDKHNGVGTGTLSYGGLDSQHDKIRLGVTPSRSYLGSSYGAFISGGFGGQYGNMVINADYSDLSPLYVGEATQQRHALNKKIADETYLPNENAVGSGTLQWLKTGANSFRVEVQSSLAILGSNAGMIYAGGNSLGCQNNEQSAYIPFRVGTPVVNNDATTKYYVDSKLGWTEIPNTGSASISGTCSATGASTGLKTVAFGTCYCNPITKELFLTIGVEDTVSFTNTGANYIMYDFTLTNVYPSTVTYLGRYTGNLTPISAVSSRVIWELPSRFTDASGVRFQIRAANPGTLSISNPMFCLHLWQVAKLPTLSVG